MATHRFGVVDSTQRIARVLARDPSTIGDRVVALAQSGGYGQHQSPWASPKGGLYLSLIRRAPPAAAAVVPLALGTALAERFERRWSVPSRVRWPNDVVAGRPGPPARKISGILVDGLEMNTPRARCILGIGVNVAPLPSSVPPEIRALATSLGDWTSPVPPLAEVEEAVVDAIDAALAALERPGGVPACLARVRARLDGRGRRALIDGRPAGRIDTLGDGGELLLVDVLGPRRIVSGRLTIQDDP
ncbi:MAG: biotin--[acetyl-CoA-carboxylase] ligase [Thermoplasmata archaeon]